MKTSSKPSIYRGQNAKLSALFQRAGSARNVLCVALDYAKSKHLALCCDGNGDVLKHAFPVENNRAGIEFLGKQIDATARRRKIPRDHIFLGGEDEPPYVSNFLSALRAEGFLVVRVNAFEAKENRSSHNASTDEIDLLGIAKTLISRRARSTEPAEDPVYQHLRELARYRRTLVRQQTSCSNRIHAIADQLFPGFLNSSRSGLTSFCEASLKLMEKRFSAPEIARRKPSSLADALRRNRTQDPEEAAARIIELARNALPPDSARLPTLQRTLSTAVELYRCLNHSARDLRAEAAQSLARTPYALLTSIPGIGFVLAAGLAGELGPPEDQSSLDRLCSYAGIVPRTFQSGGPDKPAVQGHVGPRCNRILKDWVVQSSQKLRLYGPPEIKDRIIRWNTNGQHGTFAGARRYLRLMLSLTHNGVPYLTPAARVRNADPDELAGSALATWEVLARKWRTIPGGLNLITDEDHPIGFWRRVIRETHGIQLPAR
jgi:transposase